MAEFPAGMCKQVRPPDGHPGHSTDRTQKTKRLNEGRTTSKAPKGTTVKRGLNTDYVACKCQVVTGPL